MTHESREPLPFSRITHLMNHSISRRSFLTGTVAAIGGTALAVATAGTAHAAPGPIRGTVIDFAAGVPSAQGIKNAGHLGSVRYVSRRRPGTESWMTGKPVTAAETHAAGAAGLLTASVYQFGKDATADWKQGAAGAAVHVPQAIALHVAAGGPTRRPIYMAIDDNPTRQQYDAQIRPYLQASAAALNAAGYQLGIYGNYNVIDWAIADGLGEFFWQHDWGSQGRIHPRTTIHQKAGYQRVIDGVTVDVNNVYASDWGQWLPGVTQPAAPTHVPAPVPGPAPVPLSDPSVVQNLQQNLPPLPAGMPPVDQIIRDISKLSS